jgi:hypothetical protein
MGPSHRAASTVINRKPEVAATSFADPQSAGAQRLLSLSLQLTAVYSLLAVVTYLLADRLDVVFAIACSVLFVVGTLLLALGFWNGIQRSRVDAVTLTGLVAVDRSHVPARARNKLWIAILLQIVVGVALGWLRPFTQQAFGLLVPTLGLGFAALWGSRFAAFHPREDR